MVTELVIIASIMLILVILIIRYMEVIPGLIFWIIAREVTNEDSTPMTPDSLGLTAELVEIPTEKKSFYAWIFPSESASTAGILMVPNWYQKEDHENSLKTASILHTAGYNVMVPIYHWKLDENLKLVFNKRSVFPKNCQRIIENAYEYFISRPEIDKRNIGTWSNSSGTVLAGQLIKDLPIKAVVFEDGPVTFWNSIAISLHEKRNFPYLLTKIVLVLLLFPFVWRTKWVSNDAVKNIRACPSFLIASREEPLKNLWQTFTKLHKPRQLWYEHALNPSALRDSWLHEYSLQIRSFYDLWLHDTPRPEFHHDFLVKRKIEGKYPVEVRLACIPPQLEPVPLQIILSDNRSLNELRVWFSGASMTITQAMTFKPSNIAVTRYTNVEPGEDPQRQWLKRDARISLFKTIEKIVQYPPEKQTELFERYFFLKSILLNEQNQRKKAQEILKTSMKSNHWKMMVRRDSDSRLLTQEDFEEPLIFADEMPVMRD